MSTAALFPATRGILRHSPWDALLVALAGAHGVLLLVVPCAPVIALGLWWNSNTVAHYFLHKPFFRARVLNSLFRIYLSILLGIPQTLWRERHLAHHAGVAWKPRLSPPLAVEAALILATWATLLILAPAFFVFAYVPGYIVGLTLAWVHGHYEHSHGTTSHYGALYNVLFLNDGYHAEHHAHPGEHWTRLPGRVVSEARRSRWPAVLRWLDFWSLETLECWVLRSRPLQRLLIACHERAFRTLLPRIGAVRRVAIVGGGLFPRSLLVLTRLLPKACFTIIDKSAANLKTADPFMPPQVQVINEMYQPKQLHDFDLVVFPLAFEGDRQALYDHPPAPAVVVHDWLWQRHGRSVVVSWWLLKRLNLVTR